MTSWKLNLFLVLAVFVANGEDCTQSYCTENGATQLLCETAHDELGKEGCIWTNNQCICTKETTTTKVATSAPRCTPTTTASIPDTCTSNVLSSITASTVDSCTSKFEDCGCNKDNLPNILTFDGINYNEETNNCCYEYTSKRTSNNNCGGKNNAQSHIVIEMDCDDSSKYTITNVNNKTSNTVQTDPTSCLNGIKIDHGCNEDECKYQICINYPNSNQCCTKLGWYNIKAGQFNIKHQTQVPSCNECNTECTRVECERYNFEGCPNACVADIDGTLPCVSRAKAGVLQFITIDNDLNNDGKKDYYVIYIIVASGIVLATVCICIGVCLCRKRRRLDQLNDLKSDTGSLDVEYVKFIGK